MKQTLSIPRDFWWQCFIITAESLRQVPLNTFLPLWGRMCNYCLLLQPLCDFSQPSSCGPCIYTLQRGLGMPKPYHILQFFLPRENPRDLYEKQGQLLYLLIGKPTPRNHTITSWGSQFHPKFHLMRSFLLWRNRKSSLNHMPQKIHSWPWQR